MTSQCEIKIYKSDRRKRTVASGLEVYSTFSSGVTHNSLGALQIFNQEILAPSGKIQYSNFKNQKIVLIPLVGAIDVDFEGSRQFAHIGQVFAFLAQEEFEIKNPYKSESVSYLLIGFDSSRSSGDVFSEFELKPQNTLRNIVETENFTLWMASFEGRKEGVYLLRNQRRKLFVFVIQGAFEFENRLIETGDGLSFDAIDKCEFEALSRDALLLLIECE